MKHTVAGVLAVSALALVCAIAPIAAAHEGAAGAAPAAYTSGDASADEQRVATLLEARCASCHGGSSPAAGLVLARPSFPGSVIGVSSSRDTGRTLVSPGRPNRSYIVSKLRGGPDIVGSRMPLGGDPLSADDLELVERWIAGLDEGEGTRTPGQTSRRSQHFSATRLVDLPTPEGIGAGNVLFRVSHRFVPAASSGYDPEFFGLNGPANVLLELSYGFTDALSFSLSHSNLYNEYEATLRWRVLSEDAGGGFRPVSAALLVGGSLATQEREGRDVFSSENAKVNLQLPVSRSVGDRLALLVVPSYSTDTNHWSDNSDATLAVGTGARISLFSTLSITGEWIPVLDGYAADYDGWAVGVDYVIGGHVFQVFGTNNTGVLTDQYLPGGYAELGSSDFRFGFNIFRTFWR
jgi:hypothetical protein